MSGAEDCTVDRFTAAVRPAGVRIRIREQRSAVDDLRHRSGNHASQPRAHCPNCGRVMFHVFDLDGGDPLVAGLRLWDRERLVVRVCPSCALYFEPYWVVETAQPVVVGGARDGGRVLQDVRPPYPCRAIELRALLDDDYPTTPERARAPSGHARMKTASIISSVACPSAESSRNSTAAAALVR